MKKNRHCERSEAIQYKAKCWIATSATPPRNDKIRAFTLLELSVVLVIIAAIMGGTMLAFNRSIDQQQLAETQNKMEILQKTLLNYRRAFNRIPCPADVTKNMDATSSNYYGVEAANAGTCTGGTPAANFSIASSTFTGNTTNASTTVTSVSSTTGLYVGTMVSGTGIVAGTTIASIDSSTQITLDTAATATNSGITITRNTVVGGMVPTKTLQLPDDYGIDGWGHPIMYMVDVNLTATAGFANVPVTDTATNRIAVNNTVFTGDISNGSAVVTNVSATSAVSVGSAVYGTGIQDSSTVLSIDGPTQITLSLPVTATVVTSTIGLVKTPSVIYLLLSYGKNGHGSYSRGGGSTRLANYISADADELINCHCDSTATPTAFNNFFVQKPITNDTFDDLVVYATRADMNSLK